MSDISNFEIEMLIELINDKMVEYKDLASNNKLSYMHYIMIESQLNTTKSKLEGMIK